MCFQKLFIITCDWVIFCRSPLYDEVITLCIDLGEIDAAIAIVADLETTGITVPDETLDRVISARQAADNDKDKDTDKDNTNSIAANSNVDDETSSHP